MIATDENYEKIKKNFEGEESRQFEEEQVVSPEMTNWPLRGTGEWIIFVPAPRSGPVPRDYIAIVHRLPAILIVIKDIYNIVNLKKLSTL